MLAQFGRSIFDVLVALEFAVKDSHEDAYAQQLEPALGQLATDIHTGFHYVAGCIHKWRFHVPPPGLNLEGDIAQLEARMAAVRHTGFEFSQAGDPARIRRATPSQADRTTACARPALRRAGDRRSAASRNLCKFFREMCAEPPRNPQFP